MDKSCDGCQFHSYPYKATIPILINGKRPNRLFNNKEDVLDVIKLLIEEVKENNKLGKEFDIATSVSSQLPFFCCPNSIIDIEFQEDISKYIYCKDSSIPAYPGTYKDQPKRWVNKFYVIKNALSKLEKQYQDKKIKEMNNAK